MRCQFDVTLRSALLHGACHIRHSGARVFRAFSMPGASTRRRALMVNCPAAGDSPELWSRPIGCALIARTSCQRMVPQAGVWVADPGILTAQLALPRSARRDTRIEPEWNRMILLSIRGS